MNAFLCKNLFNVEKKHLLVSIIHISNCFDL